VSARSSLFGRDAEPPIPLTRHVVAVIRRRVRSLLTSWSQQSGRFVAATIQTLARRMVETREVANRPFVVD
jgi:hypothetical protein